MIAFLDRQLLTLLIDPIKATLAISDFQISLLHGLAFVSLYVILGFPIGHLVDRRKRTPIIALGIAGWSLMTALCGLAKGFLLLFFARAGVGAFQSVLAPAAYSLLSDYFSPARLTHAFSAFLASVYIGAGLAAICGGALIVIVPSLDVPVLGHLAPWQLIFLIMSVPGFVMAVIVASLREPARTGLAARDVAGHPDRFEVVRFVASKRRVYALMLSGFALSSMMWDGIAVWIPTFFIRSFDWTPAEIGIRYGVALSILGTTGILSGAALARWLRRRGFEDANIRVGLISILFSVPVGAAAVLLPLAIPSFALICIFIMIVSMPFGAAGAALQEITPNQMRGQITALYIFTTNLAGFGVGPMVVATFTDYVFRSEAAIAFSIATTLIVTGAGSALLLWCACQAYRTEILNMRRAVRAAAP